jgi:predicted DNA binding CopG/RHH family protein
MKKNLRDSNLPIGRLTRIHDFLPPPEKLAMPEDTIKVTLLLSKSSVQFFKRQAAQHQTKYQRMIRALVDQYTARYSG